MKKSIRPVSFIRIIWLLIWIFFISLSIGTIIYVSIEGKYDLIGILGIAFSIPIFLISLFIFCTDLKKGVKFEEKCLKVSADTADKRGLIVRRLQHSLEVNYKEILTVNIEYSSRDSKHKPIDNVFVAMPYIVIGCKDGSKKAINVYYYNKKQKVKLIDEIKLRAEKEGNKIECNAGKQMWA